MAEDAMAAVSPVLLYLLMMLLQEVGNSLSILFELLYTFSNEILNVCGAQSFWELQIHQVGDQVVIHMLQLPVLLLCGLAGETHNKVT